MNIKGFFRTMLILVKSWASGLLLFLLLTHPGTAVAGDFTDAVDLNGAFIQGGMIVGKTQPGSEVYFEGTRIQISDNGWFVFGFGRDAAGTAELEVTLKDGNNLTETLVVRPQDYEIERVEGLPPATVNIPPEERERQRRERGMVAAARGARSDQMAWASSFVLPAKGRISGVYGSQRILNGEPRSPHYGLDVAAPTHTPVVAPAGGIITLAEQDFLLEGGIIIIDHGYGVSSTLFHLQSVEISVGQEVRKGDRIGSVGATGRATGPHVDWRVNWGNVRLDPGLLVGLQQE